MKFTFRGKKISGILTVVPANEKFFVEEMRNFNFPEARSLKLAEVMGYKKRRQVNPGVCVSDLAVYGLQNLFDRGLLKPEEVDALLVFSICPDHFVPPTSNIIQGKLGLRHDTVCVDVNQACAGFVLGLIQSFMLLDQPAFQKVVLVNGDVLSRRASPQDRNIFPLIGDAATITVLERDPVDETIHAEVRMDGTRSDALIVPAGGFRQPSCAETALMKDTGDSNYRADDHLRMDGTAIFNFVQLEVPPLINSVLGAAGATPEQIDFFLFHQPNRFMLQKLADKLKIPHSRVPMNVVENFGNSGGASIPTAISFNLSDRVKNGRFRACLAGFGGGLSWAAMVLGIGPIGFCDIIDFP
jgi:3-oxoacyl-[acyl-carrier-protein] synthase-3